MPIPTILLFDVDGTLINGGGAGRRALEQAFRTFFGTAEWLVFTFAGMTDRAIVRQALRAGGIDDSPELVDQIIERYLELLPEAVSAAADYETCPGVRSLLGNLECHPRCAVGLGTGNVEQGAKIKLARVGLDRCFSFGGYGSDHEDRGQLLAAGAKRGADELAVPLAQCRVAIIGDTTRDVVAALAIDAECFGVSTGPNSSGELLAAGAKAAFDDLNAEGVLQALLYR